MKKLFAHFKTIKDDPSKFVLWSLTSIVLSLSSFWIPLLLGFVIEKDFYCKLMTNNPFVVFSIIFLSNSALTSINYIGAGTNRLAVGIRGTTLVLTIMYLIFLSSIIPLKLVSDISLSNTMQFVLLAITLLLGIYVYGFRDSNWERSVDDARGEQDQEVADITAKANDITQTTENVKI